MLFKTTARSRKFSKYLWKLCYFHLHWLEDYAYPDTDLRVLFKNKHWGFIKTSQLVRSDKFPKLTRALASIHIFNSCWLLFFRYERLLKTFMIFFLILKFLLVILIIYLNFSFIETVLILSKSKININNLFILWKFLLIFQLRGRYINCNYNIIDYDGFLLSLALRRWWFI